MQINLIIVRLRVIARLEALLLVRIALHQACLHRLLDLGIQLLDRANALLLLAILCPPDWQRSTPIAATAQVPVLQILQPFAETTRTGALRLPVDRGVQLHHALTASGRADKPAIQRIVKHRLVGTPTVRIVVHMLLDLEHPVLLLQHHAELYV